TGVPLYPFGYGLSYTRFALSNLSLSRPAIHAGEPLVARATLTNIGQRSGDEVVQLYLKFPAVNGAPLLALRGFQRVHLKPGERRKVRFELTDRDLSMVSEAGQPMIAEGRYTLFIGGGQPDTSSPSAGVRFQVAGTKSLPE
ncbi:MAG TPA: fibronectin type III-like domain-contianing protein, partial [Verrucomicrobiae bacterium]|nr:fibronectin type III-like domain-contianing protein [Verrucomicrobiae bacterium]